MGSRSILGLIGSYKLETKVKKIKKIKKEEKEEIFDLSSSNLDKETNISPECIKAWSAGVVDGEGCITIRKAKNYKNKKYYFTLTVLVGQSGVTEPKMLKVLKNNYGGTISGPKVDKRGGNRLPKWNWQINYGEAEKFLELIVSYLVQKQDQALVALEYRKTAVGSKNNKGNQNLAESYYHKLREMKHLNYEAKSVN